MTEHDKKAIMDFVRQNIDFSQAACGELESVLKTMNTSPTEDALTERVRELEGKVTLMVEWLERNQPDVFSRGMWEAIEANKALLDKEALQGKEGKK